MSGKLNGEVAGHADFRARILARMSGEDVRVGVGVRPVEFQLNVLLTYSSNLSPTHIDVIFSFWNASAKNAGRPSYSQLTL